MTFTARTWPLAKAPKRIELEGRNGVRKPRGFAADYRSWTEAEDATLRAGYARGKVERLAKTLNRSVCSVRKRARRLGLNVQRRWTADDIQELRASWGHASLIRISRALKRPSLAVYQQANMLGLLAVPDGYETFTNAADRTGYSTDQLWMILRWAGVEVKARTTRTKKPGHRFHHVDPFDVDEAVELWCKTEPLECAAERHGVTGCVLRNWLRYARNAGFEVPAEPTKKKAHYRIPSDLADRVVEWRRSLESVTEAAKRNGVTREKLNRALIRAGALRVSRRPWLVSRQDVERALGKVAA